MKNLWLLPAELVGRHGSRPGRASVAPALGGLLALASHDHQMVLSGNLSLLFLQKRGLALVQNIVVLFAIFAHRRRCHRLCAIFDRTSVGLDVVKGRQLTFTFPLQVLEIDIR